MWAILERTFEGTLPVEGINQVWPIIADMPTLAFNTPGLRCLKASGDLNERPIANGFTRVNSTTR